jgi:type I restriction enzyme S subunit
MRTYDSYKDSGIEWIGELPSKWKVRQIRSLFQERKEVVSDKDYEPLSVTKKGIVKQLDNVAKTDNNDSRKKVLTNDYVINSRSDRKGSSGLSRYDGSVSVINIVLKMITDMSDVRYYEYIFKSYDFIEEFFRNGKGIVWDLWSTRYSEMKYIKVPLPPLSEQEQIVSYLDEKTSLIDKMVEKKKRKIELLKEYRTSLINTVVTKGLNPDVPMKDSGIEWIGEIPRHWELKRLKHLSQIEYGISPPDTTYNDEGIGSVLINGPVEYSESDFGYTRSLKWTTEPKKFTRKGSLLFCLRGSTTGRLNITHDDVSIGRGVCSIYSNHNQWYLIYSMFCVRNWLSGQLSGSTFPSVTKDDVDNYHICNPPLSEQQQIVSYLDEKTSEIDKTIELENKKIELLKEYRQSLISNVVTGKIKVVSE